MPAPSAWIGYAQYSGDGLAQELEDTLRNLIGLGLVGAKSAPLRFPLARKTSCRFFAPPLPTGPASLGSGGDPAMLSQAAPVSAPPQVSY